ncbi:hypothetical protein SAMN04488020_103209 [Palleronia marisminoris]|uniref:Uncharacterized protein n=2 Tax=Palleronia marisminoris TaxID=315423 RepID=A0A1Y5S9J5_9RHOB|nr:hypothetical protein SAMN04488020_103209 [Palleronia marisminoris]SLN35595.1 hypothetical protein PAM7066_01489 [Palleronia marisminoris]
MAREALVRGQWFPSPDVPGTYLARKGSGKLAELVPVETLAVIGDIVQDCMPA